MIKKITVNNKLQKDYNYELTEPIGKNFREDFKPELTPKEMLELGIMGGLYFNDVVKTNEYPKERFIKSAITRHKKTKVWSKALLQSALHWSYDPRKYLKM